MSTTCSRRSSSSPRPSATACPAAWIPPAAKSFLGGLGTYAKELTSALGRVILTARCTALHAAMIGRYLLEDLAKVPRKPSMPASSAIAIP